MILSKQQTVCLVYLEPFKYREKQTIQKDVSGKNCTMSRRIYCGDLETSYKAHVEDCNFLLRIFVAYIQTIVQHCKLAYFVSYYPLSSYEFKNSMCHRHQRRATYITGTQKHVFHNITTGIAETKNPVVLMFSKQSVRSEQSFLDNTQLISLCRIRKFTPR